MKIRISTDSTADIPKDLQEELDINVLPLTLLHDGKEYLDGVDIPEEEFYEILENCKTLPTTSQITPFRYTEFYEETWKAGYTDLIQTTINSKGSSTWQSAVQARDMFYDEHPDAKDAMKIHIIDSLTYSMGYGHAVVEGARMARAGAAADEIVAFITDWVENSRVLFVPLNLRFVKKSGRVSAAAAFAGDALGLKPIITFENGESKILTKVRGEAKIVPELLKYFESEHKPGTPYALAYGNNPEVYEKLREAFHALPEPPAIDYKLGCVIAINAGPNVVGVIYRK